MPEVRSSRALIALAAVFAASLGGCSSMESLKTANLNPFGGTDPLRSADYNYYYGRDGRASGPVTAVDLIGPDGRCGYDAAPAAPSVMSAPPPVITAAPQDEPINPGSNRALYFTAGPQAGGQQSNLPAGAPPEVRNGPRGIALAMTECEVVRLAGYTDRVQIGSEGGRRSVTMVYTSGAQPGTYRFLDGRLVSMERIEGLAEPRKQRQPTKKAGTAKKKSGT